MSPAQYFEAEPAVPSRPVEVDLPVPGGALRLVSDRGVFSAGRIDPGTLSLLKLALFDAPAPPPAAGEFLDLGCGWGPISIALAHTCPDATVWALDVNQRALALVAENAARLGVGCVHPVTAADIPAQTRFDQIWSNPPIRVGKEALHRLLDTWLPRLTPTGQAWLVVHRHLGADSLAGWLTERGWSVRRAASKSGYRILDVRPAVAT